MNEIQDKVLLLISGTVIYLLNDYSLLSVIPVIISILLSCLFYYFDNPKVVLCGCIAYALLCLFIPNYVIFLPLLLYDLIGDSYRFFALILPLLFMINSKIYTLPVFLFTTLLMLTAIVLKIKTSKLYILQSDYNELRDTSASYQRLLEEKNRSILKNQDYEISLATLNERNRISKELHDSIGHMLSRAILQVGALLTISKEKAVREGLTELKDTLSSGMDDIRKSIHNMYEESVDLYTQTEKIINEFTFCKVYFDYDISGPPPIAVRYCFIAITKEALANIMKHSDATKAQIIMREHPGLYQLIIQDNGTKHKNLDINIDRYLDLYDYGGGMGLRNIAERVRSLNGYLHISADEGFRIFVTIPKDLPSPAGKKI